MGRKKRVWLPQYFYHIVCRGNRRDALFMSKSDFVAYLHVLDDVYQKFPFELASYCLMTNHVHLQLRSMKHPISKIMSLINKRYADYYNFNHNLTGHVFEKRYFDKIINTDRAMLDVSRYIHLNPVEARMTKSAEDYEWSSYRYFSQMSSAPSYMNVDVILDYFSGTWREKGFHYRAFLNDRLESEKLLVVSDSTLKNI
jgi:putative transposase